MTPSRPPRPELDEVPSSPVFLKARKKEAPAFNLHNVELARLRQTSTLDDYHERFTNLLLLVDPSISEPSVALTLYRAGLKSSLGDAIRRVEYSDVTELYFDLLAKMDMLNINEKAIQASKPPKGPRNWPKKDNSTQSDAADANKDTKSKTPPSNRSKQSKKETSKN